MYAHACFAAQQCGEKAETLTVNRERPNVERVNVFW